MTYRLRNILIAVVLALVAAVLTSFYVTNYERSVKDDAKPETVFVATKDVPPGTAAEDVLASFKEKQIPHGDVVPGAIADKEDVRGKVATQWIFSEEQVTLRRFADVGAGGVRAELKGNLRAFQFTGDQSQVLAGTLRKGDRVDVVAAFRYKTGSSSSTYTASRVILRDVLVLEAPQGPAVGSKLASGLNDKFPVMLQLTDAQAPKLEFVLTTAKDSDASNGVVGWSLTLRAVAKAEDSPESIQTLDTMLRDGLNRAQQGLLLGKYGGQ
jgi:Flp pilus assembly protein CpaB